VYFVYSRLFCVVSSSASDCLERLVPEMTYYVSSGTLNSTHSLTLQVDRPTYAPDSSTMAVTLQCSPAMTILIASITMC